MVRKIIEINQDICIGCGLCAKACHEEAIGMVNGKATLLRDDYCDGLGDCLPACPVDAISFVEREADAYNEAAVLQNKKNKIQSGLINWPVQIKLLPVTAPYYNNANLLIAADCAAYAYKNFHNEFINGNITIIGCPKLDIIDYTEKLTDIIKLNDIKSVTVTRMQVPCCGGIERAAENAINSSGKNIPYKVVTISPDGKIL